MHDFPLIHYDKVGQQSLPISISLSLSFCHECWARTALTHVEEETEVCSQPTFQHFFFFLLLVLFKEVRVNNCCLTCLGANYFTTSPIIYTILNHLKGAFKKAFRKKKLFGALDFFCRFGKLRQGSVFT